MGKSILLTGGARSGKSELAERLALRGNPIPIYIATSDSDDAEMALRVAEHRRRRGTKWRNIHAPLDLVAALEASDGEAPRLVDCLTLWLSNLMYQGRDWQTDTKRLAASVARQKAPVIFVTNEVGQGIVPDNRLARDFRDAAGTVNRIMAETCDALWLVVAGQPLKVKNDDYFE